MGILIAKCAFCGNEICKRFYIWFDEAWIKCPSCKRKFAASKAEKTMLETKSI